MIAWALQGMAKAVAVLPAAGAAALARSGGWLLAHVVRPRRRYVLATLARCFPEKSAAERRAVYAGMCRHQALNVVELLRFAGGRDGEPGTRPVMQGGEIIQAALARGRGALVLCAHFGNYELMGFSAARLFGLPLTIVAKVIRNPALNRLWADLRRRAGVEVIPAPNAYRGCVRALRANRLVGFMLDQNRPAPQGVFVDFFGRPASTTPGLAYLSAQTGAPVVPAFMRRTPEGGHVLEIRPLLEPPADRRAETLRAFTAACTNILENEIRRCPDQWLWWHKRWKSRPAGEALA